MPVITVEIATLNKEQKKQLISKLTETAAQITNIPEEAFYVFLKENNPDNIGVGGLLLSEKHKPSK